MSSTTKIIGLSRAESSFYVGALNIAEPRIGDDQLEFDRSRRLKVMQKLIGKYDDSLRLEAPF